MTGGIRKQGKNSWEVRLYLGKDPNGRRRYKSHTVRGGKRAAQSELARLLNTVQEGNYVTPSRLTLALFLEKWLADYARQNVAAKTFERYAELLRHHVIPILGHYLLPKLDPLHIQTLYSMLLENGRRDGKGGLAPQTVVHCHRVLRKALKQAVKWQLLIRNPAEAGDPPRAEHREMNTLHEQEVATLFDAVRGTRLELPFVLAVTTGLRRGELLGLRWRDVDLEKETLAVRQSIEQTKNGLTFKEPKTRRGRRVVALPNVAVEALRRHRTEQAKRRLALGAAYEDQGLVLTRLDGRPMDPAETSKAFARVVARTGLRRVSFHGLRHTHATLLLRANVHPKVVSERLGHATVGVTLDTYSHVLPDMQEAAARKLDGVLGPSLAREHRKD
jgi:integrase